MSLCDSHGSAELRILLLGPKNAGKSSAGNTILGKKEFNLKKTLQSVEKLNEISETKITVVDTPGWWGNLPYEENPVLCKQEIVLSVTKCPPGPHVLLLVLNMDTPFKQNEKSVLRDNMKCFSDEVWRHTIVLLTSANQHKDKITLLLENENIQWLIKKCGNRYHQLNTENWGDGSQVSELLKKIHEMVKENRSSHYEMKRDILQHVEEEKRKQEQGAEKRRIKNQHLKDKTKNGNKHPLSELRMVLLGYNGSGKSSARNTILGKSPFDCKRSLTSTIQDGVFAGRHITVVDTPGRRRNYCSKYTPQLYKDEIVLCPSHCDPGPHVFLLVIRADVSFTEAYRKAVEEHVALLGHEIWDHIIVLFTFSDWLNDTSIELFIESEGEALQWIIDKCGNRYHVFDNRSTDDDKQVTKLLEKIEEMVQKNEKQYFIMNLQNKQELRNRRIKIEEGAKKMQDFVQKRNELRHPLSGDAELLEMRLVLLGPHFSGKSSTGNTILGKQVFDRRIEENVSEIGDVAGREVTVVCTSGFEKDYLMRRRLKEAQLNLLRSVSEKSSGTHAFILVQSVNCSFAEERKSAIEKIMEPLGERVWSHTLVVFAVGDELGETPIELFITSEGDALQGLIEKCGNRYHVLNNKNWGDGSQVTQLLEKIEEMVAGNKGQPYELDRDTLERVERTVAVPIRKTQSMDYPINVSGEHSASSGISSQRPGESPEQRNYKKSKRWSSGVESLGSIPEFD